MKSWLVAASTPRMAEKPTEAVRDRITVLAGCRTAAEFTSPSSLIFSAVVVMVVCRPSRSCPTSAHGPPGISDGPPLRVDDDRRLRVAHRTGVHDQVRHRRDLLRLEPIGRGDELSHRCRELALVRGCGHTSIALERPAHLLANRRVELQEC